MSLQSPPHLWGFLPACKYEVERERGEERSVQALGSPPRAGLLRLGTKALFSFTFTAALQSGSLTASRFLRGAGAPDPPLGASACVHIQPSSVSVRLALPSWTPIREVLPLLASAMDAASCGQEFEPGELPSCSMVTQFRNHRLSA